MYKLLLISILVVLSRQDSMYSFFQQMLNPNNLQRIAFSQNLKFALLYDESSKSVINYRAYDWPKTSESPFKDLVIYPKSLEFINDPQFDTCIVFGDENGVIYRGGKLEKGQAYFLITQLGIKIKKIYPSQDQTKLAVIQEGGSKVYVGDLNKGKNTFKVLDYPNNLITGVRWRPGKLQLAIVGGNIEANTSVIELYDAETELRFDFRNLTNQILVDVEFSSDSNKLYGLTANSKNDVLLPIFDLTVGKQTGFLSAYLATQLKELKRQGNFLTAFNSDTLFVWNLLTQLFYANHTSTFKTASLSIDGSDLVTNNGGTISVFKLCSDLQHFYVPADNKCLACQTPCVNCFKQKDMCSSCIPKNFLDSNFACVACLDYCLACQNATTCDKCTPGYYFQPTQCKSCAQPLPGCLSCQSKDACKVCDDKNNWVKQQKKCVCDSGFIQINKTCQACPAHCDICTDVKTCQTCDQWSNYDPTPNEEGNCVCATGFFDSNDTCKRCITGCSTCNDTESCLECNAFNNWKLEDGKCVCPQDRVANYNFCSKCSAYLTGCSKCSSITNCTECAENYTLNIVTNKCEEVQGANVIVIVVVVIAALAAVGVGGYFVWRMVKKRKAKQMQTILQSEGKDQAEQYEKIEN